MLFDKTKEDGYLFYNHKVRYLEGNAISPWEWLTKTKWNIREEIIWNRGSGPEISGYRFTQIDERIYWLCKASKREKLPRRSGNSTGYWLANETTAITQSESTFDQITLSPKNYGVLSKYSRQTLLQATPGIEELIRRDLTKTVNIGVDLAVLNGSGSSGQPTGILQTSGIGSVAGGTNGAAITLENIIKLEEEVLVDNAGGDNMGYVTNAKVLSALKQLRAGGSAAGNGSFLWNTDLSGIGRGATPGVINGYRVGVSNQVPSNLTKGSTSGECSAVLFGDYSQALVGFWGSGMELAVSDSDGSDFTKALTSVRAITTLDVAVRQASAFAAILDVTT